MRPARQPRLADQAPVTTSEFLDKDFKNKIKGWTKARPMKDANQVIVDQEDGKARFRYVLVNA